jgi:hypothetical protein
VTYEEMRNVNKLLVGKFESYILGDEVSSGRIIVIKQTLKI